MAEPELDDVIAAPQAPSLRADLLTPLVEVIPGERVTVEIQVLNITPVIETIEVRLLELVPEDITVQPLRVTLFPDESERIKIHLQFHRTLPAGTHEGTVIVRGSSPGSVPTELPLTLTVPPTPGLQLQVEPPLRVAGRKTSFDLTVENTGNTQLPVQVRAVDADRALTLYVNRPSIRLGVDRFTDATLLVKGKRPWTGAPVEHVITVTTEAEELVSTQEVRFKQKAVLTAGVITIITLLSILLLWAAAMYFGVTAALSPEPFRKTIPEGFLDGTGLENLDATLVGGALAGEIRAQSTGAALPRVTVEAFDLSGDLVAATATGDDGTYELAGLLPAQHRLRIRADGFQAQWWPGVADPADAQPLLVSTNGVLEDLDVVLVGLPGALGGQAIIGDAAGGAISVEVVAIDLLEERAPIVTTADADGLWSVVDLPTPATYRITYRAGGFAPVEVSQPLAGGEQVVINPSRLTAANGSISGTVLARDGTLLGGVEVLAQRGDTEIGTLTPTSGEVGSFLLDELQTPGTYLVTFALEGFSAETVAIVLGPGEVVTGFSVVLAPATGTVLGQAVDGRGQPLGGVSVTVAGGGVTVQTDTFTSGDIGSFRVSGLPVPGVYTVTFDLEGFGRQTVQVSLDRESTEATATAALSPSLGRLSGVVLDVDTGDPVGAAELVISDGETSRQTITASAPAAQLGRFSIGDLPPGTYTVTARVAGGGSETVLQVVVAGQTSEVELRVRTP